MTPQPEPADAIAGIHLQVMWNRLISVVEEQALTLVRTAFSTSVREAGDLSAGVFDRHGFRADFDEVQFVIAVSVADISQCGFLVEEGLFVEEQDVAVADRDNVVVKDALIDHGRVLLHEHHLVVAQLMQPGDGF